MPYVTVDSCLPPPASCRMLYWNRDGPEWPPFLHPMALFFSQNKWFPNTWITDRLCETNSSTSSMHTYKWLFRSIYDHAYKWLSGEHTDFHDNGVCSRCLNGPPVCHFFQSNTNTTDNLSQEAFKLFFFLCFWWWRDSGNLLLAGRWESASKNINPLKIRSMFTWVKHA